MNNHRLSMLSTYTVIFLFIASLTFLIPIVRAQANNGKAPSMTLPNVSALAVSGGPILLPVVTYDPGGFQASMVTGGDVNGDSKPDLVVINCGGCYGPPRIGQAGSIGVMLGNGDGSFQPAVTYNSGTANPIFVVIADVNRDGKPDLVVANRCANSGCLNEDVVSVLLGNGDGTFQGAQNYGSGGMFAYNVAVGDVNGDGKLDIVAANICANSNCDGSIGVLLGNGDGTFQTAVSLMTGGGGAFGIAIADINRDLKPDVLVLISVPVCSGGRCTYVGAVSLFLGKGDGTFHPPAINASDGSLAGGSGTLAVADVNADGNLDLLVEVGATSVILGKGDGTFSVAHTYRSPAGAFGTSAAVADVDGDGRLDLIVTDRSSGGDGNNHGEVNLLVGNGDGSFQPESTYDAGGLLTNWGAIADLNGDGKADVIVANLCADDTTYCQQTSVGVLLNNAGSLDTTSPVISAYATPKLLWPPNGKTVPITVQGTIVDSGSGVNPSSADYTVRDEYHQVQPQGKITLGSTGNFSFIVSLQASRKANDFNGRFYTIRISASDKVGNRATKSIGVLVPHAGRILLH